MKKYNPYRNIFYYYRGPSSKKGEFDKQIEDNTTKALINTLQNSKKMVLNRFLKEVNIDIKSWDKATFDLQVSGETSRPDALIKIDNYEIYIESKMDSPLEKDQIRRHLQLVSKGYLICITPREKDKRIIQDINKKNLRFITWNELYLCIQYLHGHTKDKTTEFVLGQFLEYLEAINMAPFSYWNKNDFEAFLNIEDDPKKELRSRVREKMKVYLHDLKEMLNQENLFEDLEPDIGNVQKNSYHVWGVLCKPPTEKKVHKPHFNFIIDSDVFTIGIEIEGITPAKRMKKYILSDRKRFLRILRKLDGFTLILRKKVPTERIRQYQYITVATIRLGKDVFPEDVEYLIKKVEHYDLFEFHCGISFKRDDKALQNKHYLKRSVGHMKKLKEYYDFSWGENR